MFCRRCKQWVQAVGDGELVTRTVRELSFPKFVCSCHFTTADFTERQTIRRTVTPSQFDRSRVTPLDEKTMANFPPQKTLNPEPPTKRMLTSGK